MKPLQIYSMQIYPVKSPKSNIGNANMYEMPTASPVAGGYKGNHEGPQVNHRLEIQIHIQILACVLMHFKSRYKYLSLGEIQAIMRVLEFPPRLSCSSRVSLLSLNIRQILWTFFHFGGKELMRFMQHLCILAVCEITSISRSFIVSAFYDDADEADIVDDSRIKMTRMMS